MKEQTEILKNLLEEYSLRQQERWDELAKHIKKGWVVYSDKWTTVITTKKKNRRKMKKHGKTI